MSLDFLSLDFASKVLRIILLDLLLSGDNALVIGMAAHTLAPEQRRRAILIGTGGAVLLRVFFTIIASLLLTVPLLQAVGGLLLVWIAVKLLLDEGAAEGHVQSGRNMTEAVRTIIVADAAMSLDNMLAVAGTAEGHIPLLIFGLALSIPLLMVGSNVIAMLMNRLPWLVWLGAVVLAWTAGNMIVHDQFAHALLNTIPYLAMLFPFLIILLVLGAAFLLSRREPQAEY